MLLDVIIGRAGFVALVSLQSSVIILFEKFDRRQKKHPQPLAAKWGSNPAPSSLQVNSRLSRFRTSWESAP